MTTTSPPATPAPDLSTAGLQGALDSGLPGSYTSALLTFPTGAGKTWLCLQAARETLARGERVMVIEPLRALCTEVAREWAAALPGVTVQAYTHDTRGAKPYRNAGVMVLTPERLDLLSRRFRTHHAWLAEVGLIVGDEAHLLTDPERGGRLDAALTRLRALLPLARVLLASATVGNPEALASWLTGTHHGGGERPVPLTWHVTRLKKAAEKTPAVQAALQPGVPTLVFHTSRRAAASESATLREAGVNAACYHAGLTAEERQRTEQAFRSGKLTVLCCTSAMELGLNLPAGAVILRDLRAPQGTSGFGPIRVSAAWQRAGRAGRTRGQADAHVTLLALPGDDPDTLIRGVYEPVLSALSRPAPLLDFLLGSIDGGYGSTRAQLERLSSGTLAAHQGTLNVTQALSTLIQEEALEETGAGLLRVTALGRVASGALLQPATVRARRRLPEDPTVYDVLLLASGTPDVFPLTVREEEGAAFLEAQLQLVPSRTLDRDAAMHLPSPAAITAMCALRACEVGDAEAAAELGLYAPQLQTLREGLLRVLTAWQRWQPGPLKIQLVQSMLAATLPQDAATLALLPGVGHALAARLASRGTEHLEALAQSEARDLAGPGLSLQRAAQLITHAQRIVHSWDADPTREPVPQDRSAFPLRLTPGIDPLRLARARALHVTPTTTGFTVTGGTEAHAITDGTCDCADVRPRRRCKHLLAVALHQHDPLVTAELARLGPASD